MFEIVLYSIEKLYRNPRDYSVRYQEITEEVHIFRTICGYQKYRLSGKHISNKRRIKK